MHIIAGSSQDYHAGLYDIISWRIDMLFLESCFLHLKLNCWCLNGLLYHEYDSIDFLWANQEPYAPNTYFLSNPHCVVVWADYRWPNGLLIIFSDQTWKEDDIQFFFQKPIHFFSKAYTIFFKSQQKEASSMNFKYGPSLLLSWTNVLIKWWCEAELSIADRRK
jgi:hypothetical protein